MPRTPPGSLDDPRWLLPLEVDGRRVVSLWEGVETGLAAGDRRRPRSSWDSINRENWPSRFRASRMRPSSAMVSDGPVWNGGARGEQWDAGPRTEAPRHEATLHDVT